MVILDLCSFFVCETRIAPALGRRLVPKIDVRILVKKFPDRGGYLCGSLVGDVVAAIGEASTANV